jgi:hypothetical protein
MNEKSDRYRLEFVNRLRWKSSPEGQAASIIAVAVLDQGFLSIPSLLNRRFTACVETPKAAAICLSVSPSR